MPRAVPACIARSGASLTLKRHDTEASAPPARLQPDTVLKTSRSRAASEARAPAQAKRRQAGSAPRESRPHRTSGAIFGPGAPMSPQRGPWRPRGGSQRAEALSGDRLRNSRTACSSPRATWCGPPAPRQEDSCGSLVPARPLLAGGTVSAGSQSPFRNPAGACYHGEPVPRDGASLRGRQPQDSVRQRRVPGSRRRAPQNRAALRPALLPLLAATGSGRRCSRHDAWPPVQR